MSDWDDHGPEWKEPQDKWQRKRKAPVIIPVVTVGFLCFFLWAIPASSCGCTNVTQSVQCISSAKQLGAALLIYANDHDDNFPSSNRWMDATSKGYEVKEANFHSPDFKDSREPYGYSMNPRLTSTVKENDPANTVLLFDSSDWSRNAHSGFGTMEFRHRNQKGSIGFLDNHVKTFSAEGIKTAHLKH